jgi:hypothetical protein
MPRFDFGMYTADVPPGWEVGEDPEDGELTAVFPGTGTSYVQISAFSGPPDEPTTDELWDFAEETVSGLAVAKDAIRHLDEGLALDVHDPEARAVVAFRLWRGRLVFASFYYEAADEEHVSAAKEMFGSLAPGGD